MSNAWLTLADESSYGFGLEAAYPSDSSAQVGITLISPCNAARLLC
jgi:hypothetical protein